MLSAARIVLLVGIGFSFVFIPKNAQACSCQRKDLLAGEKLFFKETPEIFTAKVLSSNKESAQFEVVTIYKGKPANKIEYRYQKDGSCFQANPDEFKPGKVYLIGNNTSSDQKVIKSGFIVPRTCGLRDEISKSKKIIEFLESSEFQKIVEEPSK